MERFALAAAVVLGFALTAALCSLFVPLRRVLNAANKTSSRHSLSSPGLHPCAPRCGVGCVRRRARWLRWAWAGLPPAWVSRSCWAARAG